MFKWLKLLWWTIQRKNRMLGGGRDNKRGNKRGGRVPVAARGKGRGV